MPGCKQYKWSLKLLGHSSDFSSPTQVNKFIDYWAGLGWIGIYIYILLLIILDHIDGSDLITVGMKRKLPVFLLNWNSLAGGGLHLWLKGTMLDWIPEVQNSLKRVKNIVFHPFEKYN